jgi:hypothetical protein
VLKVSIVAMKTWGEVGNFLAGEKLRQHLIAELPALEVQLLAGESLFSSLARTGQDIRRLSDSANPLVDKRRDYVALMDSLEHNIGQRAGSTEDAAATAHLLEFRPDMVIAMKGVACRLLARAIQGSGSKPRLVSFITNPGLLDLEVHRCVDADLVTLPLPPDVYPTPEFLQSAGRVVRLPPLLGPRSFSSEYNATIAWDDPARATVLVLSNHGGQQMVDVARAALNHRLKPNVALVILRDRDSFESAQPLLHSGTRGRFFLSDKLEYSTYISIARQAARNAGSFLVSKTGPNTMLEAICAGLPVLLHKSWLPMESWVEGFVARLGIGEVGEPHSMSRSVVRWLDEPAKIAAYATAVEAAARMIFPQDEKRLGELLGLADKLEQ